MFIINFYMIGIILVWMGSWSLCFAEESSLFHVKLYPYSSFNGLPKKLNVSGCTEITEYKRINGKVGSVNTLGNCVRLHKDKDCDGEFITLKPGTPSHSHLDAWNRYDEKVNALSPCGDKCDDVREEFIGSVRVALAQEIYNKGVTVVVNLTHGECVNLPKKMNSTVLSLTISTDVCVEVYEEVECKGSSREFPPGVPNLGDLRHWGDWNNPSPLRSLSICGFNFENNRTSGTKTVKQGVVQGERVSRTIPLKESKTETIQAAKSSGLGLMYYTSVRILLFASLFY